MNEEDLLLLTAEAAVVLTCGLIEERKKVRERRKWRRTGLYKQRNGDELISDLKFQEISGWYKSFIRMSSSCFEYLL